MTNIFHDKTEGPPTAIEQPVCTALTPGEAAMDRKLPLPGFVGFNRDVQHVVRARRGHGY